MTEEKQIQVFLQELSSKQPTPGGGGASAFAGALGAALGQMVANLTVGKKKYAQVEGQMQEYLLRMNQLMREFAVLADKDEEVFAPLAQCYGGGVPQKGRADGAAAFGGKPGSHGNHGKGP